MERQVVFGEVLDRLVRAKFPRAKAELARRLDVTPSALAQWSSSGSRPTFDNLVALAIKLDVGLDHLVFDEQPPVSGDNSSAFSSHLQRAMLDLEHKYSDRHDMFLKAVSVLGSQVQSAVESAFEHRDEVGSSAGSRDIDELFELESSAVAVKVASPDLSRDVVEVPNGSPAEGALTPIIAANLRRKVPYQYLVPSDEGQIATAISLRRLLRDLTSRAAVETYLKMRSSDSGFFWPGYTIYEVPEIELPADDPMVQGPWWLSTVVDRMVVVGVQPNPVSVRYPIAPTTAFGSISKGFETEWHKGSPIEEE